MTIIASTAPIKETLFPDPDDFTLKFYTSQAYKPSSLSIWQNGVKVIDEWDDGFTETGASEITMKEAPSAGDSLQAEYTPL